MDLNFVYRGLLPEKGIVNIVTDENTTYKETREVIHTGPEGQTLRKSGKRSHGLSDSDAAVRMRKWRAANRDKVAAANKKRAAQRREERKKKREGKEAMEKIPESYLLSKYAAEVNRETGTSAKNYIIRTEVRVHTEIEHYHEKIAPQDKENANPQYQIYRGGDGKLRRAPPCRGRYEGSMRGGGDGDA